MPAAPTWSADMTRTSPHRRDCTPLPGPLSRSLEDITGDIRDRLTVLVNAAQLARLARPEGDGQFLSALRLIEQQVDSLCQLADEICRDRHPDPAPVAGSDSAG